MNEKLKDAERQALIEEWENKPSPNPLYRGKTPAEIAKRLLSRKKKADDG